MSVAFAKTANNQFLCNDTELFQFLSVTKQSQFISLLRANIGSGTVPNGVPSGEKDV